MAHINEAGVKKINEICDRYIGEKTPLMMILSDIQNEYGYIPLEVQQIVSEKAGISVADIYGVATFYSFFSLEPKGKYVIGCCLGTACHVKVCKNLMSYTIEQDSCVGCGRCAKACPADAIAKTDYTAPGKKLPSYQIDAGKCVKCCACMATCKLKAIVKK